jgi:hypothetical protein
MEPITIYYLVICFGSYYVGSDIYNRQDMNEIKNKLDNINLSLNNLQIK